MKKKTRRIFQVCLLVAVLAVPTCMTYAYFTDYEAARGGAVVYLEGRTEIEEEVTDSQKNIRIRNVGVPGEAANVIVRTRVLGTYMSDPVAESGDWIYDESTDYWYYNGILEAGTDTPELLVDINSSQAAEDEQSFEVDVVSEAEAVSWEYDEASGTNVLHLPEGWTYPQISAETSAESTPDESGE